MSVAVEQNTAGEETVGQQPQSEAPAPDAGMRIGAGVKVPLLILATIATFAALDYAQSLMLPVVLAFILSLTLTPINMWMQRKGVWPGLAALILVGTITGIVVLGAVSLSQPIGDWIDDAPRIGERLRERLAEVRGPVEAVTRASKEVEDITAAGEDSDVEQVVVRQPGLLNRAANNLGSAASTIVVAIALTYFLLVTNRLMYEKIVHAAPRLSDKKRSLTVVNRIVTIVSKYLLTITVINACFGVTIGLVFYALGMPSPVLWGLAAFLFNYLPFVGSLAGTSLGLLVGLLTYDEIQWALAPGLAYFTITTIEGHFITPAVLGHRLELNPVMILLSIALWGFLWGIPGVILAVPILIVTKVVCDNVAQLAPLGTFLSGATAVEQEKAEPVV